LALVVIVALAHPDMTHIGSLVDGCVPPDSQEQFLSALGAFEGALVSFTHFTSMSEEAWQSPASLRWLYTRAAALVLNPGTEGSDLIVPVRFPRSAQQLLDCETPSEYGVIVIQVKNYGPSTALESFNTLAAKTIAAVRSKEIAPERIASVVYVLGSVALNDRNQAHDFYLQATIPARDSWY